MALHHRSSRDGVRCGFVPRSASASAAARQIPLDVSVSQRAALLLKVTCLPLLSSRSQQVALAFTRQALLTPMQPFVVDALIALARALSAI